MAGLPFAVGVHQAGPGHPGARNCRPATRDLEQAIGANLSNSEAGHGAAHLLHPVRVTPDRAEVGRVDLQAHIGHGGSMADVDLVGRLASAAALLHRGKAQGRLIRRWVEVATIPVRHPGPKTGGQGTAP
ncbi:hypothetical protein D9M71_792810 [compost metagenome]